MRSPDPIEAEMAAGPVVARDKFVGRSFQWGFGIPAIVCACIALLGLTAGALGAGSVAVVGFVAGGVGALLAAMFAFGWATMSVIRTVLTRDALQVKCGLWGPDIPLERIVECRLDEERGRRAVGKRLEREGWTTRFLMAGGQHVLVRYATEDGKQAAIRFTASDPEGLIRKIQRQIGASTGLRVETPGDAEAELEHAAEVEHGAELSREATPRTPRA